MDRMTDSARDDGIAPDRELHDLANYRMPFGKYKGVRLLELPEAYVVWFSRKGYPAGKLGRLLRQVYDIKLNGIEDLLDPLRRQGRAGEDDEGSR